MDEKNEELHRAWARVGPGTSRPCDRCWPAILTEVSSGQEEAQETKVKTPQT